MLLLSAAGLGLSFLVQDATHLVRLAVGILAGLFVPALTYFRGLAAIADMTVRTGTTLAALLASWTAASTLVLSTETSLTNATGWTVLAIVDLTALLTYLVLAPRTARPPTCSSDRRY
jgi:hypothetical protein